MVYRFVINIKNRFFNYKNGNHIVMILKKYIIMLLLFLKNKFIKVSILPEHQIIPGSRDNWARSFIQ